MKKFALLLLTALLALPASLYAQEPSITIEENTAGVYGWSHKLTVNPGTANEYVIYTNWNAIVNGAEFMPGYRDQFTGKDIVLPFSFNYGGYNYELRKIGTEAFRSCLMNSITIPEGVEEIEWMAFGDCDGLTTVHIPESVVSVGTNAFKQCDNLESFTGKFVAADGRSIVVPNQYEPDKIYLVSVALKGLTTYTIPSNVTQIQAYFDGAWDLKEVIIPEGVTGAINSWDTTHGEYAVFENCGITSLRIPDSLKPNNALVRNCPYLTKFEGKWASEDGRFLIIPCENNHEYYELTEAEYAYIEAAIDSGEITREYAQQMIEEMNNDVRLYKGKFRLTAYAEGSGGSTVVVPDYAAILDETFLGCETLTTVVLPETLAEINGAFSGCINLENFNVPKDLVQLGSGAFWHCHKITEFTAPATIKKIGQDTFHNCLALEKVVLPAQKIKMSGRNFMDCPNIKYIELGNTVVTSSTIYEESFTPRYVTYDEIRAAKEIDTEENYDLKRSDAVLVIPRGYGDTYNNNFPDWNYMTKENLVEKDIPANVYIGIDSETGYNLFAKRVNAEATCNLTCDDPTQEIVTIAASETSGEFNVQPQKVGTTYVTVALQDSSSDDFSVSFASKITVVDMQTPTDVEFPQGSTYTIPDDDIVVEWPDGMPEGASLSYAIADTTYVSLTDAEKGTMYAKPSAPAGSTATLTIALKDPSGNTLVTREVNITVTQHEHQWAEGNDVKCDYCDTWKLKCVPNKLNSLVRPYPGIITEGNVSIYDFSGISGNSLYGEELEDNEIEAGHPYIFKPMAGVDVIYFQATDTSAEETTAETVHGLHGVLSSAGETISATETNPVIVFTNNGLKYLKPDTSATIGFGRCYIDKNAAEDTPNLSSAKSKFIGIIENGETTGIDDVTSESAPDNTNSYNIMGGRVGETYKGIIINNGKKYIQK